jgi:formylglycine-generating enzyme required for sulfatase activity
MGSSDGPSNERPVHPVTVASFDIDRTEVTVQAYGECVSAGVCSEPEPYEHLLGKKPILCNWRHPEGRATHPINCVDWNQATAFCTRLGKRLPTEQEWEYAARRGGRLFPWGDAGPGAKLVNACGPECMGDSTAKGFGGWASVPWGNDGWPETAPVGSFPAGASIDGVEDLVGNVWEWTSSEYSPDYTNKNPSDKERVARGGSWTNSSLSSLRATSRITVDPSIRMYTIGFRCAR